jgi:hypothetical protein
MSKEKHEKLSSWDLIQANLQLAAAKVAAVLPTQPLHVVMRQQQAALGSPNNPRVLSARAAYKEIRVGQPFTALYKGTTPALVKGGIKNLTYKGALIKGAPNLADKFLPDYIHNNTSPSLHHFIKAFTAGGIAAFGDTSLAGVLETYATYLSTSHGEHAKASFLSEVQKESNVFYKVRRAYRGFTPTVVKESIAFTTFFALTDPIQRMTARLFGLSQKDKTPWYAMATSSMLCGLSVAVTSSPFDIIKTHSQMPGAKGTDVLTGLYNNFKTHGIGAATTGLPAKALMITIGWGLTFLATQGSHEKKKSRVKGAEENNSAPISISCNK